jgi:heterodisulfide reductase subunit B
MAVMEALELPLVEFERWNCCGTVYSLTEDDLMHQLASIRNLIRAQEAGSEEIVTSCAMCYNTLKRSNLFVNQAEDRLEKINAFMNEEVDYEGTVEVRHLLEIIRDRVGWEKVEERMIHSLEGLTVAPYYGCMLLRPREVGIDDPDNPTIMRDLFDALWATPVDFAFQTECCGSYQVVDHRELIVERTHRILSSARRAGADVVITSCPLCQYNLRETQSELKEKLPTYDEMPVVYFTQLMAVALGVDSGELPSPLLARLSLKEGVGKGEG